MDEEEPKYLAGKPRLIAACCKLDGVDNFPSKAISFSHPSGLTFIGAVLGILTLICFCFLLALSCVFFALGFLSWNSVEVDTGLLSFEEMVKSSALPSTFSGGGEPSSILLSSSLLSARGEKDC